MLIIREVNDLKEAEALWRALSPAQTIFDEWDFRFCFYKYEPMPLCFLAAYEGSENEGKELVGLMPLEKHPKHGYEFFAEDPSEESRPFIKSGYDSIIPKLYEAIPWPAKCFDISGEDEFTVKMPLEDYKYVLPLSGIKNWEDYLKTRLSAKKQRNLRAELRKIEALEPEIIINDFSHLKNLFTLNSANFSDSYLQSDLERSGWSDLLLLSYNWQIVSVKIEGAIVAVSLSVVYNNKYFYLINGADVQQFPNLGKFLNKINIFPTIQLNYIKLYKPSLITLHLVLFSSLPAPNLTGKK